MLGITTFLSPEDTPTIRLTAMTFISSLRISSVGAPLICHTAYFLSFFFFFLFFLSFFFFLFSGTSLFNTLSTSFLIFMRTAIDACFFVMCELLDVTGLCSHRIQIASIVRHEHHQMQARLEQRKWAAI